MPSACRTRTISAPVEDLWRVISDPHHLPRWWPRVTRVEDVRDGAFTEVMKTKKGKTVRADFDLVESDEATGTVRWEQRIEGTPFAAVLRSSQTELRLTPAGVEASEQGGATEVTIEMRQEMAGEAGPRSAFSGRPLLPSMGRRMIRRAATRLIDEALDGLERIHG
jgi:uncharacterized protein YndB with AHSA1/START domain